MGDILVLSDHQSPIFFDSTNRRWGLISRLLIVFSVVCCVAAALFMITIAVNPSLPSLAFSHTAASLVEATSKHNKGRLGEKPAELSAHLFVETTSHAENQYILNRNADVQESQHKLDLIIRHDETNIPVPASSIAPGHISGPVRVAFYVNQGTDAQESLSSFSKNYQHISHLLPVWLKLAPTGATIDSNGCLITPAGQPVPDEGPTVDDQAVAIARHNGVAILPVLQNYGNQDFQTVWLHRLLSNRANRAMVINQLVQFDVTNQCQGVNIDFENLDASDTANLTVFMSELARSFHSNGLIVTQDLPANDDNFNLSALGQINDFVIPMLYDEHSEGSDPGPLASQAWFEQDLSNFLNQIPASKLVIGMSNGAYDWSAKGGYAEPDTFGGAARTAQESKDGDDGVIRIDPASLNPYFTYYDDSAGQGDKEIAHIVWLEDATTAYNEALYAQQYKPLGMAIWRLGSEDPSVWSFFGKDETLDNFDTSALSEVTYNYFGVLPRGQGDILKIIKPQTSGYRKITVDPKKGYVVGENFQSYPSQYVIQRSGLLDGGENKRKIVALTFDDGPDPRWTPQILQILRENNVPATFFLIGENAEAHPNLVQDEWNQGMEVGNHTFTHPEIVDNAEGSASVPLRTKLELDATQRVIEALTGHMTVLFRAPNHADSEPTTEADFDPIIDAQRLGYIFVGETIDPTDWFPGIKSDQIVRTVLAGAPEGNCILLHDAGGDTRQETIKALPIIIKTLKARGYKFVLVSSLMGKTRAQLFPAVTGRQLLSVYVDRAIFDITYWVGVVFTILFIATIVLGMLRIVGVSVMAFVQSRREKKRVFDPTYQPTVSVVIAAYNEAKVINMTIATLLTSDYPNLEIVVVDDGSSDGTADTVRKVYGSHASVTVLQKENGGKASALNVGVRQCRGEIVIALDADTVFQHDTIPLLVRHFCNQNIGAVSGNVKVGNRNNLYTIWQAVEYISSQNFDRRAYDLMNCITVVPGAIGAWRKDAIVLAGMYSSQTLAEDTDLTFRVRRLGYRIVTDNEALAYTEAPDTLRSLFKQRFRWAYGTLQCLWKHRGGLLNPRYGTFGMVAMPSMWIYQIGFQALAPIVDLTVLWSIFYCLVISPSLASKDMLMLGGYWALYTAVEIIGALPAMILDKEDVKLVAWLPLQRFVYRQLMYFVILKSIYTAIHGSIVGWGKIERKGTVAQPAGSSVSANLRNTSSIGRGGTGDGGTSIDSGDFAQKR